MIDSDRNTKYISLDKLIAALQEAKDHCVDGRSKVFIKRGVVDHPACVVDVEYNSKNVTIAYE